MRYDNAESEDIFKITSNNHLYLYYRIKLELNVYLKQAFCAPMHPGMNAFTERVIGTIRREALEHFLLFSEKQARNIINQYVEYYNHLRPHQSIEGIPEGNISRTSGNIKKEQVLGGLHHDYYRSSA